MAILNLDQALIRVEPVASAMLVEPYKLAVEEWNRREVEDPDFASAMDAIARAGIINRLAVRNVRTALVDIGWETARETPALDFFAVAVGDDMLLRYKFVGSGSPQNIPTRRQRELARHEFDDVLMEALRLDGIGEPPTLVTCGYTLGLDGKLGTVSLQCDHLGRTLWHSVVWGDNNQGFGDFALLPISPDLAPEPTIVRSTRRVREEESGREAR